MSCLEILHHIACLDGSGLGDGASEKVDNHGVFVGCGDDEGKEELRDFADAGDGVQVCFAEGADAHDGEEERQDDGSDGGV